MARATGRARPARDERRPARSETSGASHRTSETSAGRAETSRRSETSGASCRTSQEPAVPRDECGQKRISHLGRRLRDERAWREPSFGDARYEQREGVRGRPKAAGRLAQKLPSPALKEAERSGSYNPSDLNTLTGGTVRSGTVQGQQREEQRTPCPVNLRGPERTRSGEARRVRDTDQGQESVLRRD